MAWPVKRTRLTNGTQGSMVPEVVLPIVTWVGFPLSPSEKSPSKFRAGMCNTVDIRQQSGDLHHRLVAIVNARCSEAPSRISIVFGSQVEHAGVPAVGCCTCSQASF